MKNYLPFKMPEHGYSPDAIERLVAKEAAIANGIDRTKEQEPANLS
jgi:hypothetical protein